MSLEQAINANTEAVLKLVAIFSRYVPTETAAPAVAAEAPTAEAPKPAKKATKADVVAAVKAQEAAATPEPEKPAAPAAPAVSLADLQEQGKKLIDAGKQADLKALVTRLGSTKLSLLPAEKYAEALAELKKLTAAL